MTQHPKRENHITYIHPSQLSGNYLSISAPGGPQKGSHVLCDPAMTKQSKFAINLSFLGQSSLESMFWKLWKIQVLNLDDNKNKKGVIKLPTSLLSPSCILAKFYLFSYRKRRLSDLRAQANKKQSMLIGRIIVIKVWVQNYILHNFTLKWSACLSMLMKTEFFSCLTSQIPITLPCSNHSRKLDEFESFFIIANMKMWKMHCHSIM